VNRRLRELFEQDQADRAAGRRPVDPATTDAERAAWDVPPLAAARRRAAELTCGEPPGTVGGVPHR
jgi:hypothetical protein